MKIIIVLLALISSKLFSQSELPFDFMYLTTDLNGVVEINKSIITYGNYGVIMTSDDIGKTWRQKTIGNDLNIKKIIKNGNDLYGIANNIIFKSYDGGNKWILGSVSNDTLLDISYNNDQLVLLSKNNIFSVNTDFQTTDSSIIRLNEIYNVAEFQIAENNIFIPINNGKIIKFNLQNQLTDTLNFKYLGLCDSCSKPTKLKFIENNLHVLVNEILYSSDDEGKTWKVKAKPKGIYNVKNNEVFSLNENFITNIISNVSEIDYFKFNLDLT
jgi:hypothetical protein